MDCNRPCFMFSYQQEARGISVILVLFLFCSHIRVTVYSAAYLCSSKGGFKLDASSPHWLDEHLCEFQQLWVFSSRLTRICVRPMKGSSMHIRPHYCYEYSELHAFYVWNYPYNIPWETETDSEPLFWSSLYWQLLTALRRSKGWVLPWWGLSMYNLWYLKLSLKGFFHRSEKYCKFIGWETQMKFVVGM